MSKKVMLITGASRGIGRAIKDKYIDEYEIITVHRSPGATIRGDLTDWKFREQVIESVNPDVVVNNAGTFGYELWAMAVNGVAAAHLMIGFHKKMSAGHIINISSVRSEFKGFEPKTSKPYEDIAYNCGKAMCTSASLQLASLKSKPINVVCIEPGIVRTNMYQFMPTAEYGDDQTQWNNSIHTPLESSDIVNTVDWVLKQPPWINISLLRVESNSSNIRFK